MIKQNALPWLLVSAIVILLDQITKQVATNTLVLYESVAVMPSLNWTLLHNYGAAFSFLNERDGWQRWLFTVIAIAISAILMVWLSRLRRGDWRTALPIALIIGGAIGNLVDRLRYGYVVDFVDVYYGTYHWPAFNIADSAITVGAILMIVMTLFEKKQGETSAE